MGSRFLLFVAIVCMVEVARADEIPIVTLGDAGPDRSIPIDKSYYLASTVPAPVTYVRPVIVRTRAATFIPFSRPSCQAVIKSLGMPDKTKLQAAGLGEATRQALWAGASDDPIYVGPGWARGALEDKQTVKLLIEGESKFFQRGADYCLYVFRINVSVEVAHTLEQGMRACAKSDTLANLTACVEGVLSKAPDALKPAITGTLNAYRRRETVGRAILAILGGYDDAGPRIVTPEQFVPIMSPHSPLVTAILALAVGHNALRPQVEVTEKDKSRSVVQYTLDAAVRVNGVGLTLDDKTIVVFEKPADAKGPQQPLTIKTDQLLLPDSPISIYELLRWTRGEIKTDGGYVQARELVKEKWSKLADPAYRPTEAEVKLLRAVEVRTRLLATVMLRAFEAQHAKAKPPGTADVVYAALGEWLVSRVTKCSPTESVTYAPDLPGLCDPNAKPGGWAEYASSYRAGPVGLLANQLDALLTAQATIDANPLAIRTATESIDVVDKLPYQLRFTQETWIFSYVTPVIGYATVAKDGGTQKYLGVQIHFVPNEVNEPQWSNGKRDWARAFAIELGTGVGEKFGPDDRYDGPGELPTLFAGVAFHALPYTSFSGGVAIFDRRASTLTGEAAKLDAALYFGVNLQFNVPGIIGGLFKQPTTTENN